MSEIEIPTYHACKGDVGPTEVLPVAVVNSHHQEGDICFSCGQIYGQPEGEINPLLDKYKKIMEGLING